MNESHTYHVIINLAKFMALVNVAEPRGLAKFCTFYFLIWREVIINLNILLILFAKEKEKKTESLTLRMEGVGGLGRQGVDGIGGLRRSWVASVWAEQERERERERDLKRDIERARERAKDRYREG
jgi:hypothetical protein